MRENAIPSFDEDDEDDGTRDDAESERAGVEKKATFSGTGCSCVDRRRFLFRGMVVGGGGLATGGTLPPSLPARAGLPEIDSTGQLYSPRSEMLSGGSAAARGIPAAGARRPQLRPGETIQSIYETRFVAYLSRFLLNFDPSLNAWWMKQGLPSGGDDDDAAATTGEDAPRPSAADERRQRRKQQRRRAQDVFAEFAESVEVGLADYFSGPCGSYS